MITINEAIKKAKDAYPLGLISKDGYTDVRNVGDDDGFYVFEPVIDSDEKEIFDANWLCVSKQDGEVSFIAVWYLMTHYSDDIFNPIKIEYE